MRKFNLKSTAIRQGSKSQTESRWKVRFDPLCVTLYAAALAYRFRPKRRRWIPVEASDPKAEPK